MMIMTRFTISATGGAAKEPRAGYRAVLLLRDLHTTAPSRKIALRTVGPRRTVPASDENPGRIAAVRQQPSPPRRSLLRRRTVYDRLNLQAACWAGGIGWPPPPPHRDHPGDEDAANIAAGPVPTIVSLGALCLALARHAAQSGTAADG